MAAQKRREGVLLVGVIVAACSLYHSCSERESKVKMMTVENTLKLMLKSHT